MTSVLFHVDWRAVWESQLLWHMRVMTDMLESRWALHTRGFCVVIHEVIH